MAETIQSGNRKISLDLVDEVNSFTITTDESFTLKGNEEHGTPLTENTEVEWHMDRMDEIREEFKKVAKKLPSMRTVNCIGIEAAYGYRRK